MPKQKTIPVVIPAQAFNHEGPTFISIRVNPDGKMDIHWEEADGSIEGGDFIPRGELRVFRAEGIDFDLSALEAAVKASINK
jgi:hypothetical protein